MRSSVRVNELRRGDVCISPDTGEWFVVTSVKNLRDMLAQVHGFGAELTLEVFTRKRYLVVRVVGLADETRLAQLERTAM